MTSIRPIIAMTLLAAGALACEAAAQVWQSGPPLSGFSSRPYTVGVIRRQYVFSPDLVYCLGGSPFDANHDSTVQACNPAVAGGGFSSVAPLDNGPLLGRGAGVDLNNRIIVFGGYDPIDGDTGGTDVYDPAMGLTMGLASRGASAPDWNFAFCTDDQRRIYSLGGGPGEGASSSRRNSAYCERYVPTSNVWQPIHAMNAPVGDACAVFDQRGRILVFGGVNATGSARTVNVAAYDIASDTWSDTDVPDMPVAISAASAVIGSDGRVYVIGGQSGAIGAGTTLTSVFKLDLETNTWSLGPSLSIPRRHFGAALYPVANGGVIYAMGGDNNSGGTGTTETLYTADCPSIIAEPTALRAYAGQTAGFSVVVAAGAPITYQWRRNGVALTNGLTPAGSTIVGATADGVGILHPAPADAGEYDCVVTNPCGSVTTSPVALTVVPSPILPTGSWQFVDLHPAGATASYCNGVSGAAQVGRVDIVWPNENYHFKATLWNGDSSNIIYLHDNPPYPNNGPDYANAVAGNEQVGVFYQFIINSEYPLGAYYPKGAIWSGTPGSLIDLGFGAEPYETDGAHQVGVIRSEDIPGDETQYPHAWLWSGTATSGVALQGPGGFTSAAYGLEWPHQYGGQATPRAGGFGYDVHAKMWSGSAQTQRDLHPLTAYVNGNSYILGAGDGLQAGYAGIDYNSRRAAIWSNSAASWLEVYRAASPRSQVVDTNAGYQLYSDALGVGDSGPVLRFADILPPGVVGFAASSLSVDAVGTIRIGGNVLNHAAMLVFEPNSACPADFNQSGAVTAQDIFDFLAAFFTPGSLAADFNHSGAVSSQDIFDFLAAFFTPCP